MKSIDKVYADRQDYVIDFAFDENVAAVFPDMIRRSIPGYETIISLLGVVGAEYVSAGSRVYDLGCSLGASLLSIHNQVTQPDVSYIGVDTSNEMLSRCRDNVAKVAHGDEFTLLEKSALDVQIENASVVVMNFTLQFMPPETRQQMLKKIYEGLLPNGVLVLSEKLEQKQNHQTVVEGLHRKFKSLNGYSELEISQKRTALEKVMLLDTEETHINRLSAVGFEQVLPWFTCFNFSSFLAIKS